MASFPDTRRPPHALAESRRAAAEQGPVSPPAATRHRRRRARQPGSGNGPRARRRAQLAAQAIRGEGQLRFQSALLCCHHRPGRPRPLESCDAPPAALASSLRRLSLTPEVVA
ncbi:hypothetical protein CDD83_2054 [Cordyceps sp. RAO-2017]|nr:hypothetical protein CDD83_2054 [Cordyceps sp. RAO-2017]